MLITCIGWCIFIEGKIGGFGTWTSYTLPSMGSVSYHPGRWSNNYCMRFFVSCKFHTRCRVHTRHMCVSRAISMSQPICFVFFFCMKYVLISQWVAIKKNSIIFFRSANVLNTTCMMFFFVLFEVWNMNVDGNERKKERKKNNNNVQFEEFNVIINDTVFFFVSIKRSLDCNFSCRTSYTIMVHDLQKPKL